MQAFKKVDMESWPRREHYRYYTEALKVEFNMTAPVDVQNLLRFCHAHGYKFYAAAIYCVTKALGRIENFRMFKNADGELCVWDKIVPNFTFFHPDDCTFSDCWTDFSEDFPTFYNAITADMQTYKDVKGIKTKPNQPANFYCVSVRRGRRLPAAAAASRTDSLHTSPSSSWAGMKNAAARSICRSISPSHMR